MLSTFILAKILKWTYGKDPSKNKIRVSRECPSQNVQTAYKVFAFRLKATKTIIISRIRNIYLQFKYSTFTLLANPFLEFLFLNSRHIVQPYCLSPKLYYRKYIFIKVVPILSSNYGSFSLSWLDVTELKRMSYIHIVQDF